MTSGQAWRAGIQLGLGLTALTLSMTSWAPPVPTAHAAQAAARPDGGAAVEGDNSPARSSSAGSPSPASGSAAAVPTAVPAAGGPASSSATPGAPATSAAALERLRAEHSNVKDALFRSRARRETLANALLSTRFEAVIEWEGGRRHALKAAELRLDGVRLWDAAETPPGERPVVLAPRGIAPGTHVLSLRIDVRARDNAKLGYVSEQSFTIVLDEGKTTKVEIAVDEDGDLPGYNPDIEVEVSRSK